MEMIRAEQIYYSYQTKYQKIDALKNVSYTFDEGKFYAITGESGSGKSTLLSLLAGLDLPLSGDIYVDGTNIKMMNRDDYRAKKASVVYQSYHLFPLLTALENVMFPMEMKGIAKKKAKEHAQEYMAKVGLNEKILKQFPKMMSGGEQQRVAIARALATGGRILLADEPTGNLDMANERNIVELLKTLAHQDNYTVIVVTHNALVADEANFVLKMRDGELLGGCEIGA